MEKLQKWKWMKSIKDQIKIICIVMLTTSLLLMGVVSVVLNFVIMQQTLRKNMSETAFVAAEQVYYNLQSIVNPVEVIGSIARLTSENTTLEQKQELLNGYLKHYGWESLNITDETGNVINSTANVGNTEYFKNAIAGNIALSEPAYNDAAGKMTVLVAAPLWKSGLIDTEVAGVVFANIDATVFIDLVSNINISEHGSAYIIDGTGNTIAHADFSLVEAQSNTIKDAQTDSGLKRLAQMEQSMIEGKDGFGHYKYGGVKKYMAYAPIGINGWSIAITAPNTDFNRVVFIGIFITIILLIVTVISAGRVANKFGIQIGGAVDKCAQRLKLLTEGDLTTEVPIVDTEDETKILAESTAAIVEKQYTIIGDISYYLNEMAAGNFAVRSKLGYDAYVGEYSKLYEALRAVRNDITKTVKAISEVSAQVETGSAQLANASQNLAEGASEQAGAVEQLLTTVTDVTEQVEKNNQATDMAHEKIKVVGEEANQSSKKMEELTQEMKNIEVTSAEINDIIAEIEEIASQTNLLSLNASIEAARAGEAGRGFAVVADQIGKLAEESAQSAVNTRRLIEASLEEIQKGSRVTSETAEHMERMMNGLSDIMAVIADVREASDSQTAAIEHIKGDVDLISNVVQNNSAAAQESSATSQELSSQAQMMEELVARFKLAK